MTPEKMTIDELINAFQGCDKVTFTLTGVGEKEYGTIEFKDAIEAIEAMYEKHNLLLEISGMTNAEATE